MLIDIISGTHYQNDEEMSVNRNNISIQGFGWTDADEDISDYFLKCGEEINWSNIFGAFSAFITTEDKCIVFTDNSNLQCVYISDHAISDS